MVKLKLNSISLITPGIILVLTITSSISRDCGDEESSKENAKGQEPTAEEIAAEEQEAIELINKYEELLLQQIHENNDALWNAYKTYKLKESKTLVEEITDAQTLLAADASDDLRQFKNWPLYENVTASRKMRLYVISDPANFGKTAEEYLELTTKLFDHQTAQILCVTSKDTACESTSYQIEEAMMFETNVDAMTELWLEPRIKLGTNDFREDFVRLGELWDIAAKEQNYVNAVDLKLEVYHLADELYDNSMAKHYKKLWKELKPFYQKLHAVVSDLLKKQFGDEFQSQNGLMPAMFVGLHGREWQPYSPMINLYNRTEGSPIVDVSAVIEEMYMNQERSVLDYVTLANEFMMSMNLIPISDEIINDSYFVEEDNTDCDYYLVLDFMDGENVRLGTCAGLGVISMAQIYRLLSAGQQCLQYGQKSPIFRQTATYAWIKALDFYMVANFYTPAYMGRLDLLTPCEQSEETTKFFLMLLALQYYPVVSHSIMAESYRDDFFLGKIDVDEANCEWYKRIAKIQGLYPPMPMNEEGFHPAGHFNLMQDSSHLSEIYEPVFGLQLFEYLCEECNQCNDGEYLHKCDLTGCEAAGEILGKLMSMGAEFSWQSAYKEVFGVEDAVMSGKAMNRYFQILEEDFDAYIEENELTVGWEVDETLICEQPKSC